MTERKFTDEEVIKALECHVDFTVDNCHECPYLPLLSKYPDNCVVHLAKDTLDLINRQRAEIEGLKGGIAAYEDAARESHKEHVKQQAIIDEILTILKGGQPNDPPSMPAGLPSEIG